MSIREKIHQSIHDIAHAVSQGILLEDKNIQALTESILLALKDELMGMVPDKDSYAKGLAEDIGALLMGNCLEQMRTGFEEYKKIKEIDNQRNIGFNACRALWLAAIAKIGEV